MTSLCAPPRPSICGREQEARDERVKLLREGHISVEDLPRDEGGR